jgi:Asp/Glu/hydantoin racemase
VTALRLWLQSAATLETEPRYAAYRADLVAHVRALARPGTEVEVHGTAVMVPEIDYVYVEYLHTRQFLENGLAAQAAGCSAFVLNCWDDPGLTELRSLLDIPVVSIGESSMLVATMLGERFGLVTRNERVGARVWRNVESYGLASRGIRPVHCPVSLPDLGEAFARPEPIIERFVAAGRHAIELGAEVLLPACGVLNLLLRVNKVTAVDDAPIVDGTAAAVKTAEAMADLWAAGFRVSRRTRYARPPAAALAHVRAVYGQEAAIARVHASP